MKTGIRKVRGFEYDFIRLCMVVNIWWIGIRLYKNPFKSFSVVRTLVSNFNRMMGKGKLVRAYKVDSKYAWDMFNPAWPSKGFNRFFESHLVEIQPAQNKKSGLRRLLIAITKRCPLNCEHCSEADTLYQQDVLSLDEFKTKIQSFVDLGVGQLVYSGGEPLSRFEDLIQFIQHFRKDCDQWIYTSGFGLTLEKALRLKKAGLNGAAISLDHHLEIDHDAFRRNKHSYQWVMDAVRHCQEAGILVAINVCPSRSYVESNQVEEIIELAKAMNIPVVNLLEPRAVGNFYGKDVEFGYTHKEQLKSISEKYNFNKANFDYPTVLFPAAYRAAMPCGGGRSYLLLDYDGSLYPCPFCKTKIQHASTTESLCTAS